MENVITKILIEDHEERLEFLPQHCGRQFLKFENAVYRYMSMFVQGYSGGFWEYYNLSNGGFYMAWDHETPVIFENVENYVEQEMSVDAASIAINLYALSNLSFQHRNFADKFHLLRDYAAEHTEADLIFKSID